MTCWLEGRPGGEKRGGCVLEVQGCELEMNEGIVEYTSEI